MACFWLNQTETHIEIPTVEDTNNIIYYKIEVKVGESQWNVRHRYSEFFELHSQLVNDHGVSKDILPSKKVIRNKCPTFIENRRKGLEDYCHKILHYLKRTMPRIFVEFFNFHVYDIFYLMQNMALRFYMESDAILEAPSFTITPIEIHSVSECLKLPRPMIENIDNRYDFMHVLDLYSKLEKVIVEGSNSNYLQSNIIPNDLSFEFSSFKELKTLTLKDICLERISSVGNLRSVLQELSVHNTNMNSISQILQCDVLHKCNLDSSQSWTNISMMNLSNNNLAKIDETVILLPNVQTLILDSNKITSISGLSELSNLSHLSISNNLIQACTELHTKMGNILTLNLSQNAISSLRGFSKLYSLVNLDLSSNKISEIEEIAFLEDLPCLENLILTGNSVATVIDYRVRVLQYFKRRAKDICLDNERPCQNELDKVSVLRALNIVKEGKMPDLTNNIYT